MYNKKNYKFTPGRPVLTTILLLVYALGSLSISIAGAIFLDVCMFAWSFAFFVIFLWLPATLVIFIASIGTVWNYIRRIRYLRGIQRKVPRSYIVLLVVIPIVPFFILGTMPVVSQMQLWNANSRMNSYAEFESYAKNCRIESISYYSNNTTRKSPDSNAYIEVVVSKLYDSDDRTSNFWSSWWLYYSYNQKDNLEQIYKNYSAKCQNQTEESQSDRSIHGDLPPKYKEIRWDTVVKEYSFSC